MTVALHPSWAASAVFRAHAPFPWRWCGGRRHCMVLQLVWAAGSYSHLLQDSTGHFWGFYASVWGVPVPFIAWGLGQMPFEFDGLKQASCSRYPFGVLGAHAVRGVWRQPQYTSKLSTASCARCRAAFVARATVVFKSHALRRHRLWCSPFRGCAAALRNLQPPAIS